MKLITVTALGDFWTVRCEGVWNDLLFASGARAESVARGLAASLAQAGKSALLHIFDRSGAPAGRFIVPPAMEPPFGGAKHKKAPRLNPLGP